MGEFPHIWENILDEIKNQFHPHLQCVWVCVPLHVYLCINTTHHTCIKQKHSKMLTGYLQVMRLQVIFIYIFPKLCTISIFYIYNKNPS